MEKPIIYITKTPAQTKRLGFLLARGILNFSKERAPVLALRGDLGAGKTQFAKGFAQGLGIKETVNSPTFVILRRYRVDSSAYKTFYHIDLYRLGSERDLENLGISEIIANPENIVIIEWPEVAAKMLSGATLNLDFKTAGKNGRQIEISG